MNSSSAKATTSIFIPGEFQPQIQTPVSKSDLRENRVLKQAIWVYFILLIFEGALRKWFLPFLATPLLVIRDPIALWVTVVAFRKNLIHFNRFILMMLGLGIVGIFTAIIFGHGNLYVAIYGARILMIEFPFLFVIGNVLSIKDVVKIGRVIMWLSIPMVVLICIQFYSPQSAWVNRGVGGDMNGAGFSGALGYFRPPGTFSFINGTASFFSLAAAFVLYFWFNPNEVNRILLLLATGAVFAAIPFSISRELFFSILVSTTFALLAVLRKPKYAGKFISAGVALLGVFIFILNTNLMKPAKEAFSDRFETANDAEGGVVKGVIADRYFGNLFRSATNSSNLPFFGLGLGMGTNVGSQVLIGKTEFLIAEGEWGRLVGEMGAVMGLSVIIIRVLLAWKVFRASYRNLKKGNLLPWMLVSFGILTIPQGLWGQPTSLGFGILIGGLILSSLRTEIPINSKPLGIHPSVSK